MILQLRVSALREVGVGVRAVHLRSPDGAALPSFPPGSHLVVDCGGRPNCYSLTSAGTRPDCYAISVLHRPGGAGGSAWVHALRVGDAVQVSPPRSAFAPVATARHHLLVAGGIGVTPLLSHLRAAQEWDRSCTLVFAPGRAAPHLAELCELCGTRLTLVADRRALAAELEDVLPAQPLGTHLYVCGPDAMTTAVLTRAGALGWPAARLHSERFSAPEFDAGRPFTARLARSGRDVHVPAGTSLLDALLAAGVPVPNLCRQGVCGECRVPVLAGRPEHRDVVLSAGERRAGTAMMACVSRAAELVQVDL